MLTPHSRCVRRVWPYVIASFAALSFAHAQPSPCYQAPTTMTTTAMTTTIADKALMQRIRASNYAISSSIDADALSLGLLECLASPDPEWRDAFTYETLGRWIRRGNLKPETMRQIASTLQANLTVGLGERGTNGVFRRTFSALVLSDLLSRHNSSGFLDANAWRSLVESALVYLPAEQDLRGFNDQLGWMHGVAHGSDMLYRLAQNSALDKADQQRVLAAVLAKVAPTSLAYSYGEDERLARPVLAILARGTLTANEWSAWIEQVMNPSPLASWNDLWGSEAGLAKRHNTKLFLLSLNLSLTLGNASHSDDLLPAVKRAIEQLP
jgi:Protein of unknown function (DUF2785)